jgi:threonine/homoserine/homoserine lactone efflux protein
MDASRKHEGSSVIEIVTVFLGICLAQASPGPNMMAVASAALGADRRSGIATAMGIAIGVFCWALLFSLGIGTLLTAFPQTLTAMKFLGGAYLLYLGFKSLRAAARASPLSGSARPEPMAVAAALRRGLLVVMTNPKAALMWVAITMFLASTHLTTAQFLLIGASASASAMAIYGTYAVLFSSGVAVRAYTRFFRAIEGTFGALFGAIGAKLVLDGIRSVRG